MAKTIRIAPIDTTNWATLPGSTGDFNKEAETLDDTIFGQNFMSKQPDVLKWSINANAYYKGFSGYQAKIMKTGNASAFTDEACSYLATDTYQITDTAKRLWDPDTAVVVEDAGVDVTAQVEYLDYLSGTIKFLDAYTPTVVTNYFLNSNAPVSQSINLAAGTYTVWVTGTGDVDVGTTDMGTELAEAVDEATPFTFTLASPDEIFFEITGSLTHVQVQNGEHPSAQIDTAGSAVAAAASAANNIRVTGASLALTQICTMNQFTLTQQANAVDETNMCDVQSNGGFRQYIVGLKTVMLDLSGFFSVSAAFQAALTNRSLVVIEIGPDGSNKSYARGFFKPSSQGQSGKVGALEEESVKYELFVPDIELLQSPFKWYHANDTTLNTAIQTLLSAWESDALVEAQYLYDGTNGWTGEAVPTDVSLKGGIGNLNEFTVNLQGSGALTAVP